MTSEQTTTAPTVVPPAITGSRLYQFSRSRPAQIPKEGLEENSTGAILACAFFMGAAEAVQDEERSLGLILATHLGLTDRGSAHLIDTTRRLISKYPFVAEIFSRGGQVAHAWQDDGNDEGVGLVGLLAQSRSLTLMELDIQGINLEYGRGVEEEVAVESRRSQRPARMIFIILLLIALAAANYFVFR
jgi:hypothetical protein